MSIDVQTAPNQVSLLRTELGQALNIGLKHFDVDYLEGKECITRTAQGRAEVYFFNHHQTELVLRHYYRGGLLGKVNKDWFLYTGIENTRGFLELDVLDFLRSKNVDVSNAVAARIVRQGMFYRADIMTVAVPHAQELHEMLKLHPVDDEIWSAIGTALGKLHNLDVRHDDINVKNILIRDNNEVVLIDFDKCQQQPYGNWKSANIARFYRSLIKQHGLHKPYHFVQSNWETLELAYNEATRKNP
ncbi:3-deoxy-D-manno-octulosonic acid kinase [Glaciecola sp. XM2]|uniref:3-deoxy-D-manno-octulosonic acid kinase n=1 Tax=Glaciecola sp. XM2 TaxID=1914931 RepID=UPI001BDF3C0D|nr:3-deoxy-D-manno-octulosonic acid kinase [Glaciecola sp. XM2]MBT1451901.1 3-deoxy-D-manno-octulosonic acid kinase [Glaciecola sp. XM2]